MTDNQRRLIENKIEALSMEIQESRFNENFARKLNYPQSADCIGERITLLVAFKVWLRDLLEVNHDRQPAW